MCMWTQALGPCPILEIDHMKEQSAFVNPLGAMEICATPKDIKSLEKYIALFSGNEAVVAFTVMGMSWNLASATIDAAIAATYRPDPASTDLDI